jgi:hypothetical protein
MMTNAIAATVTVEKIARRRDPNAEIGVPAQMHMICPCGQRHELDPTGDMKIYPCGCGLTFDALGWVVGR